MPSDNIPENTGTDFISPLFKDDSPAGQKAARTHLKENILPKIGQDLSGAVAIMQIVYAASKKHRGDLLAEIGSYMRRGASNELKTHIASHADDLVTQQTGHQENKANSERERCAVVLAAIISSVTGPQEDAIAVPTGTGTRQRLSALVARARGYKTQPST
jgi:hypothetical protein